MLHGHAAGQGDFFADPFFMTERFAGGPVSLQFVRETHVGTCYPNFFFFFFLPNAFLRRYYRLIISMGISTLFQLIFMVAEGRDAATSLMKFTNSVMDFSCSENISILYFIIYCPTNCIIQSC